MKEREELVGEIAAEARLKGLPERTLAADKSCCWMLSRFICLYTSQQRAKGRPGSGGAR